MDEFAFDEEDQVALCAEEFAERFGVSRAFIRLVLGNGCPNLAGSISRATLLEWLEEHYETVRSAAGLQAFPPLTDAEQIWEKSEKRKRAFLTALEFTESRACLPATRKAAREVTRQVMRDW